MTRKSDTERAVHMANLKALRESSEVYLVRNILTYMLDEAKAELVTAPLDVVPRTQGRAQALEALLRLLREQGELPPSLRGERTMISPI